MGLRVNPDLSQTLLNALAQDREAENEALSQVSTGRKVNTPSQDPAAVALLVLNHDEAGASNQFLANISNLRSRLQVADSTLNSVTESLTQAISVGVQGGDGTLSASNRQALAQEVSGIQQQLMSLANATFQGEFLFAGTDVTTQPFVSDPNASSGVGYVGNSGVNSVEASQGQFLPVNLPGNQLFTSPGADVFQALADLSAALNSGSDVSTAVQGLQNAFNQVNAQRTFYGNTLTRLDTAEQFLNSEKVQLSQGENDLVGVSMDVAASNLVQAETVRNAALAAGGRISQLSLLDYLK